MQTKEKLSLILSENSKQSLEKSFMIVIVITT